MSNISCEVLAALRFCTEFVDRHQPADSGQRVDVRGGLVGGAAHAAR